MDIQVVAKGESCIPLSAGWVGMYGEGARNSCSVAQSGHLWGIWRLGLGVAMGQLGGAERGRVGVSGVVSVSRCFCWVFQVFSFLWGVVDWGGWNLQEKHGDTSAFQLCSFLNPKGLKI